VRRVRTGLATVALAAACSEGSETSSPPPVRAPERDASASSGGSTSSGGTDGSVLEPTDGSSVSVINCTNGQKDGQETDVDCGGPACAPCVNGKTCAAKRDCTSGVCAATKCSSDVGCADGTREGLGSVTAYANVAACVGAWSIAGVLATTTPACGRAAGNDGTSASGAGCNVADLCQIGWHVCATAQEVGTKIGAGGCAGGDFAGTQFFVTRQSGAGIAQCGAGANDLFGCGDTGAAPDANTCGTLNRFSSDLCVALPATWSCGTDGVEEANAVTKTATSGGGVLCCRD
jgi:hypothetical protein